MISSSSTALWRYSFFNLAILILISAWFWQQNKPVALVDPPLAADGKLHCVSYAPYYGEGQTPFIVGTRISQMQIESDLKLLAERSQCVRIYSVGQGLDYVPEAASKIGLKVLLGAWIGWVKTENEMELDLATRLANQYPQTVIGLVVGNEVLLRGEQTEQAMADYLKRAKLATKVPVTYADVWEFWLRHKALESSVDFITVHILPYWEDDPQPVSNAMNHVNIVMDKLAQSFQKDILIGETGWPSAGRHRNASVPSNVNQARYIREFLLRAHEANWNYNLIEAVDQPWKRLLEGAVGGYWGLYDTGLKPKFPFSGDVAERHDGMQPLFWSIAGLAVCLGIAFSIGERRASALFGAATLGASAGLMALLQLQYLVIACRDSTEWVGLGALNLVGIAAVLSMPLMLARHELFSVQGKGTQDEYSTKLTRTSLLVLAVCAAIAGLLLMPKSLVLQPLSVAMPSLSGFFYNLDGRYRDFPLAIYLLPVLQLTVGLRLARLQALSQTGWGIYRYLTIIALLTMTVFLISEPLNVQAYAWLALVVLIAITTWPRRQHRIAPSMESA